MEQRFARRTSTSIHKRLVCPHGHQLPQGDVDVEMGAQAICISTQRVDHLRVVRTERTWGQEQNSWHVVLHCALLSQDKRIVPSLEAMVGEKEEERVVQCSRLRELRHKLFERQVLVPCH